MPLSFYVNTPFLRWVWDLTRPRLEALRFRCARALGWGHPRGTGRGRNGVNGMYSANHALLAGGPSHASVALARLLAICLITLFASGLAARNPHGPRRLGPDQVSPG